MNNSRALVYLLIMVNVALSFAVLGRIADYSQAMVVASYAAAAVIGVGTVIHFCLRFWTERTVGILLNAAACTLFIPLGPTLALALFLVIELGADTSPPGVQYGLGFALAVYAVLFYAVCIALWVRTLAKKSEAGKRIRLT